LIHGEFGAGKSFLIAVLVICTHRLYSKVFNTKTPKILLSSMTNVAVDRVLTCLLELGFDRFLRVGSLKKIAKQFFHFPCNL